MDTFIEFVVDTFIQEADKWKNKPQMLKVLREESEEELVGRVMFIMDDLEMRFVVKEGKVLEVMSRQDNAEKVVRKLKERLASELVA